jgi:chemotaxis-related protein WspD
MSDHEIDDCWNRIGVWANSKQRTCPLLDEVVHCANCEVFSLAGKTLLEGEAPAGYLEEWAKQLAAVKASKNYDSSSIILFRLGDEWLGIATGLLDEVVSIRPIHTIPHRRGSVLKGLTNIRGELQLCISIGRLMNITRGEISGTNVVKGIYERMVVMSFNSVKFVFPVSEVRGVYRFSENDLQEAPATAMNCSVHYLRGMLNLEGRHVGVVDHQLLFPALERAIL